MEKTHNYGLYAENYANLGLTGTYYLPFRDLPDILKNYTANGKRALDYGCGTGRSTRFLKTLGFDVIGADISPDMLKQAEEIDSKGCYKLIESGTVPFPDESFDIIFSSYVFLEVSDINEIVNILTEMKRLLKKDGHIVFVTSIVTDIKNQWLSFSYDFAENKKDLSKCENLKLLIKDNNIVLYDYNWIDKEYKKAINDAGLCLVETINPMGKDDDPFEWLDEKIVPYCYIYVVSK